MRHTCEHCGTRYEIPDAKIEGRRVKVRCQHCEGVMMVVGPGAEAPEMPGAPASGIFFYADHGQPAGPVGPFILLEKARTGIIGARSYIWTPGMKGWERVIESPSLRWLYDAVMETQLKAETGGDVFDRAALMSDGRGYFPDPTLKSGVILLDQTAQHQLETIARQQGLIPEIPDDEPGLLSLTGMAVAASLALGAIVGTAAFLMGWGEQLPALSSLLGSAVQGIASL